MGSKYDYLKKYIDNGAPPPRNWFKPITIQGIDESESRLGFEFPNSLKEFWLEIGYGFFKTSHNNVAAIDYTNRLCSPDQIADIILLKEESELILPEAVECYDEKDIPFFEVADSYSFLIMKPTSSKPDAVFNIMEDLVEESFERFIWRLYYESPTFYLSQVEEKKEPTFEEKLIGTPARGWLWEYIFRNYKSMLSARGSDIYQAFLLGGEPEAERVLKQYDEIVINRCSKCGNVKRTPKANQCLSCGVFSVPVLTRE